MPPPPSPPPPMIITSKFEMRHWSRTIHLVSKSICLVPTMGFLHAGHLSLIAEARTRADTVVVSIYVNPGQFSRGEDIGTYPSDFEGDLGKIRGLGAVDVVFHPYNLYDYRDRDAGASGGGETAQRGDEVVSCVEDRGGGHETWVRVEKLEKGLCGKSRPLFFRGVATVVTKLFNIVQPDVAIFGKKDYQQWRIIQRMVRDLDLPVQIIGAEIVREDDGLALSSRNVYLSPEEREKALSINRSLSKAKSDALKGQIDCKELRKFVAESIQAAGGRVDYSEIVNQESLEPVEEITGPVVFCVAAWFGNARLLDNVEINIPK